MEGEKEPEPLITQPEKSAEYAQFKKSTEVAEGFGESMPGVVEVLGKLPAGAIITEAALARILNRHPVSIKRAVERREIPPPVRLLGAPVWLAGCIITFLQKRLETAEREFERERRRLDRHRP